MSSLNASYLVAPTTGVRQSVRCRDRTVRSGPAGPLGPQVLPGAAGSPANGGGGPSTLVAPDRASRCHEGAGWRAYHPEMPVRTVLERGPKNKKVVALAVDWPGWSRGAKTPEAAIATLESYRSRYRPITLAAGMVGELDGGGQLAVVQERVGTGSTDFWGISFSPSSFEDDPMAEGELERKLRLLQACWSFFDEVAASVSPQMRKGPRGGGRDRDQIIAHTIGTETELFAKRVGLPVPADRPLAPAGLADHRAAYLATMRSYNAGVGKRMRTWTLPFLIRHTAFHVLDHAWEMQDKDLSADGS